MPQLVDLGHVFVIGKLRNEVKSNQWKFRTSIAGDAKDKMFTLTQLNHISNIALFLFAEQEKEKTFVVSGVPFLVFII